MNEEQFEAHMEKAEAINELIHKAHGWRYGATQNESRRARIKRLRRWDKLPVHYPDRFTKDGVELVSTSRHGDAELFISKTDRLVVPITTIFDDDPIPPVDQWPAIEQYNGYCRFKRKPVYERGYNGLLSYVPVHGGITYANHELGVSTYGFDTAHANDESNPLVRNLEWLEYQCVVMTESIRIAARFEPDYLKFKSSHAKVYVIDRFHKAINKAVGAKFDLTNNFGAMINAITGRL